MRIASLLPLTAAATTAAATATSAGCKTLNKSLSSAVFAPSSTVYQYEAQNFWSNTEIMSPGCVFRPQSAEELSQGVKALVKAEAQFAVRGGGHMGIRVCRHILGFKVFAVLIESQGSNNIDNGVLIVMSNLTTLELSDDQSVVSVGPAYRYLFPPLPTNHIENILMTTDGPMSTTTLKHTTSP